MSTRERLARASHLAYYGEPFDKESQPEKDDWRRMVDAILRELKNPSEEMISAMMHGFHLNKAPRQAMHDALVNGLCFVETEGRSIQVPIEGVVNAGEKPA